MFLKIDISNLNEVVGRLLRLSQGLQDRTELHQAIGLKMRENTDRRFNQGAAPDGTRWKESLRAKEKGGQTLRDTGLLQNSIDFATDRNGLTFGAFVGGSNIHYARIHQEGGVIKPKKAKYLAFTLANGEFRRVKQVVIPARPYIGVSPDDEEDIVDLAVRFMERLVQ